MNKKEPQQHVRSGGQLGLVLKACLLVESLDLGSCEQGKAIAKAHTCGIKAMHRLYCAFTVPA